MQFLFDAVRVISIYLTHAYSLYLLSSLRPSLKHPLLLWSSVWTILSLFSLIPLYFFGFSESVSKFLFIVSFLTALSLFIYCSSDNLAKKIFLISTYSSYFMLTVLIGTFIAIAFFSSSDVAIVISRSLLSLVFIILLKYKLNRLIRESTEEITKGWTVLASFSFIAFFIISVTALYAYSNIGSARRLLFILVMELMLISSSYAVVLYMIGLLKEQNRLKHVENQQVILMYELDMERAFVEQARAFRHDQRHHFGILMEYLKEGKAEDAERYLAEYEASSDDFSHFFLCHNRVLNALLNITSRRAEKSGVAFNLSLSVPEKLPLSSPEEGIIFGNILENAITAAEKSIRKKITVRSMTEKNVFLFEVRNTYDGNLVFNSGFPVSTKKAGGMGLRNVQRTLDKYGGMMNIMTKADDFIVQISLPL